MNQSAIIHNYGDAATGIYKIRWFLSRDQVVNNSDDITLLEATLSDNPMPGHFITRRDPTFIGYTVPNGPITSALRPMWMDRSPSRMKATIIRSPIPR